MKRILRIYINIEDIITSVLMICVVFFVFIASVLRWIGYPLAWTTGLAELIFVWVIFLGANKALRLNQHIGVDYFVKKAPLHVREIINVITNIIIITFLIYLSVEGIKLSLDNFNRKINNLSISYFYVTIAVPVGCLLMSITLSSKTYNKIIKFINLKRGE